MTVSSTGSTLKATGRSFVRDGQPPFKDARQRFLWGWFRLFLGLSQMALVSGSLGSLFVVGLHLITIGLACAATILTLLSRALYGGKKTPESQ
jgi:hypothetical protein